MFLSRLSLNVASAEFRRDFVDVQHMHRTVQSAFPELPSGSPARKEHGVLWRMEPAGSGYTVLVQSLSKPAWDELPQGYLSAPAEVRGMDAVLDAIAPGRRFAFRLVAVPLHSLPGERDANGSLKRGRKISLRNPDDQIAWIIRRGERHGFVIPAGAHGEPNVAPSPCPPARGRKSEDSGKVNKITVSAVRFDGQLVVTDAEALTEAVRDGISSAKAYGCGLLSLYPLPPTQD
ncbi:type I-E CRISPR-associated protein Cas6/Cse3/CasE [Spiractinospora alimapuensis]|uniref:type I-E CRISPR-associated protein Cas6/Cse3/CasE n=1 Tax=Spiractinospora alimapuensis TaxID=2820884 RepID=UPI001EEBD7F6|nr:type I-E CRISPR-associated protein Cas6/Cse3/CasE [Spiractinospora alimapuensis]QVQ51588.1 type I-E CRISPR-associated protein Cas6/Cse3/CasE [Spiractinospora alimapuensis]